MGEQPRGTRDKRVFVRLRNGYESPTSWPADGRFGVDWALVGSDFDIVRYRVERG